jgi:hypothetical protein
LLTLLTAWFFVQLRPARADNAVSYKYVDYRESGDRMSIQSHYGLVEQDLGPDFKIKLQGVVDSIAGATPTGQPPATPGGPVPLTDVTDRRKAWSVDLTRAFARFTATAGFANSREDDYVSNGWSLNTLTDFNQKNTTLLLGLAGTDDKIKVFYQTPWAKKRATDFIAGVTQLLDPRTTVTFNLGYGHSTGYHADPYRVIQRLVEVDPGQFLPLTTGENRPDKRDKWTVFSSVNHSIESAHAAIEASYRFFHDSFGTDAHTIEIAWFQKVGAKFVLRPSLRYYDQTAADFYRLDLNGVTFTPTGHPMPQGPFYSADYRLSAFRSVNYGLKAIWTITPALQIDAALEKYDMHGKDSVTSPSVYPKATIVTAGLRFSW